MKSKQNSSADQIRESQESCYMAAKKNGKTKSVVCALQK